MKEDPQTSPPPTAPRRLTGLTPNMLRGWLHIGVFWLSGIGTIILNSFALWSWLGGQVPPRKLLGFMLVLVAIAAAVFRGCAEWLAWGPTHRQNRRYARSVIAGICYGVGFFWVPVLAALALRRAANGANYETPSWFVPAMLGWWLVALPGVLGWLFGRWLREIKPGSGVCTTCGYDLRATAGRCPECGSLIPAPPES